MDLDLSGKHALVCGGSEGIGRAAAEELALLGAHVTLLARREEALRAHVGEVRMQIQEWGNGRERRSRYERELVPLARDRTRAALAAYRGGKSSLSEVLAARRNEIEVRMQALQLEMDTARLWAQINFLFPDDDAVHPGAAVSASSVRTTR